MANTYDIEDTVRSAVAYLSTNSTAIDPTTVRFHKETPAGVVSSILYSAGTGDVVRASQGNYYIDITTTSSGTYELRWTSTGTAAQTNESWFFVRTRRVST